MGPRRGVDGTAWTLLRLCRRCLEDVVAGAFGGRRQRSRGPGAGRRRSGSGLWGLEGLFSRRMLFGVVVCFSLSRLSSCFIVGGGGQSWSCPLQQCWDSYHGELDAFRIREDFHSQPSPISEHARSTTEWRRICSIYRTFSGCVQNASRDCVGDLNFHSTQKGVARKIAQYNCTFKDPGKKPETDGRLKELDEDGDDEEDEDMAIADESAKCNFQDYNTSSYRHCSMYGDPHLRTFGGVFQTCRIQGAWPLIDTDFLTVQITSSPVGVGEGTLISEVTVVIKRNDSCALDRYVTYEAQNGELPGTFDNGLVEFNTVEIFELVPRLHVEIDIGYKQAVVIIRLIGLAYSVSVTLPETVYLEVSEAYRSYDSVHLCQVGCPTSERVDLNSYFGQKSSKLKRTVIMAKKEAIDRCRGLRLTGFYFDSCVYDLMTTGDTSFTGASYASYSDLLRFIPNAATVKHRNLTLDKFDETANASNDLTRWTYFRIIACVLLAITVHLSHRKVLS